MYPNGNQGLAKKDLIKAFKLKKTLFGTFLSKQNLNVPVL